jgi:hypothetical protein
MNIDPTAAAKLVRRDLKTAYPGTKFTVRAKTFSMGSSVEVTYFDGPAPSAVVALLAKYEYNRHRAPDQFALDGGPQVKYVGVVRDLSAAGVAAAVERFNRRHGTNLRFSVTGQILDGHFQINGNWAENEVIWEARDVDFDALNAENRERVRETVRIGDAR